MFKIYKLESLFQSLFTIKFYNLFVGQPVHSVKSIRIGLMGPPVNSLSHFDNYHRHRFHRFTQTLL